MEEPILKEITQEPKTSFFKEIFLPAGIIVTIILSGSITGYFLSKSSGVKKLAGGVQIMGGTKEVGIKDEKTFKDTTEGRLEANNDTSVPEGSHKLIRPGGASKTAYLTSSVVDLNRFVGKCVQIWGETFAAQKAGWLMDVGRVKPLDSCPEGL
jgi:hypothetical protein